MQTLRKIIDTLAKNQNDLLSKFKHSFYFSTNKKATSVHEVFVKEISKENFTLKKQFLYF